MGGQPQIVAAMVAGAIQGGVLSSPADFKAKKAGFHQLVDFKTSVSIIQPSVWFLHVPTSKKIRKQ